MNSDDRYSTTVGKTALEKNGVGLRRQESEMQYLGAVSKTTEWSVHFQGKPFNITVIQVYAPTSNVKEAEAEQFYDDLQTI